MTRLPAPAMRPPAPPAWSARWTGCSGTCRWTGRCVLRLPPAADVTPVVAGLAQRGPTLVLVPSVARAEVLAGRLRRAGGDVALLPGDWAQARAGAAVVIGARAAAWGPCPGLAAAVVVDGHDEGLGSGAGAPTWHAAWVVSGTGPAGGRPVCAGQSVPDGRAAVGGPGADGGPRRPSARGGPPLEVVDRRLSIPGSGCTPSGWCR